jgi:hypothetical protein
MESEAGTMGMTGAFGIQQMPLFEIDGITIPLFHMEGKRERDLGVGSTA